MLHSLRDASVGRVIEIAIFTTKNTSAGKRWWLQKSDLTGSELQISKGRKHLDWRDDSFPTRGSTLLILGVRVVKKRQLHKTCIWKQAYTAASSHQKIQDSIHARIRLHYIISPDPPNYLIMFIFKHASSFINFVSDLLIETNILKTISLLIFISISFFGSAPSFLLWPFLKGKNN